MVKAVIFDLDGLLADTENTFYQIYVKLLKEYGREFKKEVYTRDYCGKTEAANVIDLIRDYRLPWTFDEGMERVLREEKRFFGRGVSLKPGAGELLAYLKENGYQIALASSSIRERAMNILDRNGVTDYFEQLVFGPEVERGKPYPDIFLRTCEKLGRHPEDCLVLEDSEAGLQAASAANIPVICIPDMKMPDRQFLDKTAAVLDSLDQVIRYLSEGTRAVETSPGDGESRHGGTKTN